MPDYRLVFTSEADGASARAVSFTADSPTEALIIAQRRDSPAELWQDGRRLCTLSRSASESAFWIIS